MHRLVTTLLLLLLGAATSVSAWGAKPQKPYDPYSLEGRVVWKLTKLRMHQHHMGTDGPDSFFFHFSDTRPTFSLETDCSFTFTKDDRDWKHREAEDGLGNPCDDKGLDFGYGGGHILLWRYFGALGTIPGMAEIKWSNITQDERGITKTLDEMLVPNQLSSGGTRCV